MMTNDYVLVSATWKLNPSVIEIYMIIEYTQIGWFYYNLFRFL